MKKHILKKIYQFIIRKWPSIRHTWLWLPIVIGGVLIICYILMRLIVPENCSWMVDLLAIVGTIFTLYGVRLTYIEVRKMYARINGYDEFFHAAIMLMKEVKDDHGRSIEYIHFYGPTILPGNITCEDKNLVKRFGKLFEEVLNAPEFNKVPRILIVPTKQAYEETYGRMIGSPLRNVDISPCISWDTYVNTKKNDAVSFQNKILNMASHNSLLRIYEIESTELSGSVITRKHDNPRLQDISKAYFLCNGIRMIYAIPLHYTSGSSEKEKTPHLAGFTSTFRNDIKAFKNHFDELRGNLPQIWHLKFMYDRHLINPNSLAHFIVEKGIVVSDADSVDKLADFDHDHFGKKKSTETCISLTNIDKNSNILDVGCGLGGPARYIAHKMGCRITGIEICRDRFSAAQKYTMDMKLENRVNFILGDAAHELIKEEHLDRYTHIIAFLSILHIEKKQELLKSLGKVIKQNGRIFIEDFCLGLTPASERTLIETISCPNLLSKEDYIKAIRSGNINIDKTNTWDMTTDWSQEATERLKLCRKMKNTPQDQRPYCLNDNNLDSAIDLYEKINNLFHDGAISGIRIIGTKGYAS